MTTTLPTGATTPACSCKEEAKARLQTAERITEVAAGGPPAIERRLLELEHEWSVERFLKITAALGTLVGLALAILVSPWWFLLPVLLDVLLLQYGLVKRCVLMPVLRRFGLRTTVEIEQERYALKALRGDFRGVPTVIDKDDQEAMARMEGEGGPAAPPAPEPDNRAAVDRVLETVER
jgi:hypothetical protein